MTGERLAEIAGRLETEPGLESEGAGRWLMTGLDLVALQADAAALLAEVRRLRGVVEFVMEVALGRDGTAGADPRSQVELIRDRLAFEPDGPGEGVAPARQPGMSVPAPDIWPLIDASMARAAAVTTVDQFPGARFPEDILPGQELVFTADGWLRVRQPGEGTPVGHVAPRERWWDGMVGVVLRGAAQRGYSPAWEREIAHEFAVHAGVPTPIRECWSRFDEIREIIVGEAVGADGRWYALTVDPGGGATTTIPQITLERVERSSRAAVTEARRLAEMYAAQAGVPGPTRECWTRFDDARGVVHGEAIDADGRPCIFSVGYDAEDRPHTTLEHVEEPFPARP